ncbi:MAG: response regulator transcription factor [Lachnospiraceae bacterium]|nr:response regulator transcription factor [Lachnospiraceae bacterium]
MKKVLILEDDPIILEHLSSIVQEIDIKTTVFMFNNTKDASQCLLKHTIDLFIVDIILDTHKPGDISGLSFVEAIRCITIYGFTPVIIVTSLYDEKMVTYEELHCYSFIEKPFDKGRLKKLIEKALAFPGISRTKLLKFHKDGIIFAIEREHIVYVESANHILHIHTTNNDVMHIPYKTIKGFLEEVDSNDFIQCSRSTVINRRFVHNVDMTNRVIQLQKDMGRVDIGIMYKNQVKEMFS